jgi:glutamine synthetase
MLAAGVAGIVDKIEPTGETTGNGYEQDTSGPDYARSMPEAIERFASSSFAHDWLGDRFVDGYSATRRSQYDAFRSKVPDVELERFFDLG